MASEINTLLERIEEEHLALQYIANALVGDDRHHYIQEKQRCIDSAYARLLELCGNKAHHYVAWAIQWVNVSYKITQELDRRRRHIYEHRVAYMHTLPVASIPRRTA